MMTINLQAGLEALDDVIEDRMDRQLLANTAAVGYILDAALGDEKLYSFKWPTPGLEKRIAVGVAATLHSEGVLVLEWPLDE